ncbi:MAG: glycosyltransferase family 4 protein [Patescibacteria group bacterium]|nr:glycosyltransferase family 4 protein [Patescibacteria group bacterium]
MKVAIISTLDLKGGASIAAYNLHRGLLNEGVESKMFVQRKSSRDSSVLGPRNKFEQFWGNIVCAGIDHIPRLLFFRREPNLHSTAIISSFSFKQLNKFKPDIVNLHWVWGGFFKPEDLKKIKAPIIWTLHDMWPFCGAEHYPDEALGRFKQGYLKSNRKKGERGIDLNRLMWLRKKKIFDKISSLTIVTPSKWLSNCAKESVLFKNIRIETIPYGIDTSVFTPANKEEDRKKLDLPLDKKLILFGATNGVADPRKGFRFLKEALNLLENGDDVELVVFGSNESKNDLGTKFKMHNMGIVKDQNILSQIYSACDVFIIPSTQDNLPNTVLESIACGTPVVGFAIGGIPDMIDHQKNGYLAKPFEANDIAKGIDWILKDKNRHDLLCHEAREKSLREYSLDVQAQRYIKLYQSLLEGKNI